MSNGIALQPLLPKNMEGTVIMPIRRQKNLKHIIFVAILMACLAVYYSTDVSATSASGSSGGIDAILVIDTSGSMRTADRERTAIEAAKLFIDMVETRNSRIGIVEFTNVLHTEVNLTPVNTVDEREELRSVISGFEYRGWTDIGLALRSAAEMILMYGDRSNSPMILLFTDGDIELPVDDTRTVEMSYDDVNWSVNALAGHVPVYTIGLNYHGDVNIDFLRSISDHTRGRSYIVNEASALPLIFSEIFASHIRSSLTEIADFVAEADQYTDVTVPIPSAFVAEANIIMLSNNPLINVQLIDPEGNRAVFDGINHILTYANRYSMIKSIAPTVGDWTLSVLGVPEDRITVNLIYNFDVNVSASVSQANVPGPIYDPTLPVTVNAGFIFADQRMQTDDLFINAEAKLHVHSSAMELLYILPMRNTGSNFTVDYITESGMDVHFTVHVQHPDFETSSAFLSVSYSEPGVAAAEAEAQRAVHGDSEATDFSVSATDTAAPTSIEYYEHSAPSILIFIVAIALLVLLVSIFFLFRSSKPKAMIFSGYLEVRALLDDGLYTALEAPDLSTFHGCITLYEFLSLTLKNQGQRILKAVDVGNIYIQPDRIGNDPAIRLQNKGNSRILNEDETPVDAVNSFIWQNNKRLIFTHKELVKLEITYRSKEI